MSHTPNVITYSSVVTRESPHNALTLAGLHDLEVRAADILNAYVMASNREKILTILDLEFGDDASKSAINVRALYDLKSVGALFRAHLT